MSAGHDLQRADALPAPLAALQEVMAAAIVHLAAGPRRRTVTRRKLAEAVEAAAPGIVARTREELV